MSKAINGLHVNNKGIVFLFSLLMGVLFSHCSVARSLPSSTILIVKFGSSGGFTGERIAYELKQNGELSKNDVLLKKVSVEVVQDHFKKANDLLEISFNNPGNLSKFIEIETNSEKKEFVWNATSQGLDERIPSLYQSLLHLTR